MAVKPDLGERKSTWHLSVPPFCALFYLFWCHFCPDEGLQDAHFILLFLPFDFLRVPLITGWFQLSFLCSQSLFLGSVLSTVTERKDLKRNSH